MASPSRLSPWPGVILAQERREMKWNSMCPLSLHTSRHRHPQLGHGDTAGLRAPGRRWLLKPNPPLELCKASLFPASGDCHPAGDPLAWPSPVPSPTAHSTQLQAPGGITSQAGSDAQCPGMKPPWLGQALGTARGWHLECSALLPVSCGSMGSIPTILLELSQGTPGDPAREGPQLRGWGRGRGVTGASEQQIPALSLP